MAYQNVSPNLPAVRTTVDSTAGAGTTDTVSTFAGAVYATDSAAILGNFHQLAQRIILLEAALKTRGIVVT